MRSKLSPEARIRSRFEEAESLLELRGESREAYVRLAVLRARLAVEAGVPAYRVLTNRQLRDLALRLPADSHELASVRGLNVLTAKAYGPEIVAAIYGDHTNIVAQKTIF